MFKKGGLPIEEFPAEARLELSSLFTEFATCLKSSAIQMGSTPPAPGSPAHRLLHSASSRGPWTQQPAFEIARSVSISTSSAMDHLYLLGVGLRDNSVTTSLATLARASIEALARIDWVVTGESPEETTARWLSLLLRELTLKLKYLPETGLVNDDAESLSLLENVNLVGDHLTQIGYSEKLKLSPTELVTAFLEASTSDARQKYSKLSGVAHGEHIALWDFVAVNGSSIQWHLDFSYGMQIISAAYYPLGFFLRKLSEWTGHPLPKTETWAPVHEQIHASIVKWAKRTCL